MGAEVVKSCASIEDIEACYIAEEEDCFYAKKGSCLTYYGEPEVVETCGY